MAQTPAEALIGTWVDTGSTYCKPAIVVVTAVEPNGTVRGSFTCTLRGWKPVMGDKIDTLLTVHAAKGLEFETVYVIGLAEREMPSWQSCNKGDASPEMEEERRNCFVAITRTQYRLALSSARNYRGYARMESRFLREMFPDA